MGCYLNHAMLNLGQAARDIRWFFSHPHADRVAPPGTLEHRAASAVARLPSLFSNLYYAALPPSLHHSREELREAAPASPVRLFLHGYAPWRYPLS